MNINKMIQNIGYGFPFNIYYKLTDPIFNLKYKFIVVVSRSKMYK